MTVDRFLFRDSCRIQTCNLHIRSVTIYSVDLMSRPLLVCECKGITILFLFQIFCVFFHSTTLFYKPIHYFCDKQIHKKAL